MDRTWKPSPSTEAVCNMIKRKHSIFSVLIVIISKDMHKERQGVSMARNQIACQTSQYKHVLTT